MRKLSLNAAYLFKYPMLEWHNEIQSMCRERTVCTVCTVCTLCVRIQRFHVPSCLGHIGVPDQSCGSWTLFLMQICLNIFYLLLISNYIFRHFRGQDKSAVCILDNLLKGVARGVLVYPWPPPPLCKPFLSKQPTIFRGENAMTIMFDPVWPPLWKILATPLLLIQVYKRSGTTHRFVAVVL